MNRGALLEWVAEQHKGQLVKKTGQPYLEHLIAVAEMAAPETEWGYEIGLCHDLFEKTKVCPGDLKKALLNFGYEGERIVQEVIELTDAFNKKAYPELKKAERKQQEEARLTSISADAQTVKYADLIYNIRWVLRYAPDQQYLDRKKRLLIAMDKGSKKLRDMALDLCKSRPVTGGF